MKVVKFGRVLRPVSLAPMRSLRAGQTVRIIETYTPSHGEYAGKNVVVAETSIDNTTGRGIGEIVTILEEFIEYIEEGELIFNNDIKPAALKAKGFLSKIWGWIKNIFS